ncbi:MAG TPA: CadC family transcriptional regulator, partial [Edaphobacter sp.]
FLTGMSSEGEVQLLRPGAHEFVPAQSFYSGAHRMEETRDSRWLAWTDAEGRLWRARTDGSELLQLTPADLQVFTAHWSPDGSRLALMARASAGAWSLYQVLADGSDLQPLLQTASNAADPTWSPDGQSIALGQVPDLMGKDAAPRTIQILNLKSRQIATIPNSSDLFSPRWSPDGRFIAALSLDQRKLKLYDVTTKQWRDLASRSAADPVWSSDSRTIYADAFMEPGQPVYRVSVGDGRMEELGGMSNLHSTEFSDLVLCGVLHDGTVAVRARLTTASLFSLDLGRHDR